MKTMIAILILAMSLMTIMARPDEAKIKAFEEWAKKGSTVFDSELELELTVTINIELESLQKRILMLMNH